MSSPYMPVFIADYLADTAHLSAAEHGAYLLLIMNYWQRGKPLPADDRKLARIARMSDDEWADARCTISEFFIEFDGEWAHKRIEAELAVSAEKSAKAKASARASVSARKAATAKVDGDDVASAERTLNERSAYAELLEQNRTEQISPSANASVDDGREARPPPAKRGSRIPDDFDFDEKTEATGREEGLSDDAIRREFRKFVDWARSAPGDRGLKRDWQATARNWLRKAAETVRGPGSPQAQGNRSSSGSLLGAYQRAADRFRATDPDHERWPDVRDRHPH